MKVSELWLRDWVNPEVELDQLVHLLTMAGLEVDAVSNATEPFNNVVIGEIKSISNHPDADKLNVCQVSDGENTFQVVCGAANVAVGALVPFAKVGAVLPGNIEIKSAKLNFDLNFDTDEINEDDNGNDFETILEIQSKEISNLLKFMKSLPETIFARLTGSGSCIFAAFESKILAEKSLSIFNKRFPLIWSKVVENNFI